MTKEGDTDARLGKLEEAKDDQGEAIKELQIASAVQANAINGVARKVDDQRVENREGFKTVRQENKEGLAAMNSTLEGWREDEKDRKLAEAEAARDAAEREAKQKLADKQAQLEAARLETAQRTKVIGWIVGVLVAIIGAIAAGVTAWVKG